MLKLKNRNHSIQDYLNTYEKLIKVNPMIKFSSDFIIAYPGEDKNDFNNTLELVKKLKLPHSPL